MIFVKALTEKVQENSFHQSVTLSLHDGLRPTKMCLMIYLEKFISHSIAIILFDILGNKSNYIAP